MNKDFEYREVCESSTRLSGRRLLCLATCDCCGGIFLEKFMSVLKYVTDFNSNDTYSQVYTNSFAATKMSGKIYNNYGFLWFTQLKKCLLTCLE